LAKNGKITLEDGQTVQLMEISRNDCPADVPNCKEEDSAVLGVGPGAMVADLEIVQSATKQQGERATCVAFTVNSAIELLKARASDTVDLSEQYTYFTAKQATSSWDSDGINPSAALSAMIEAGTPFIAEANWPYNAALSCDEYRTAHPGFACSETEAQGGGEDGKSAEPKAEAAPELRLKTAHRLFASLGRIKQALYRGHPVLVGVNANSDFSIAQKQAKKGVVSWVFQDADCDGICGHAVLAVGYQDDERVAGGGILVLKNSWGEEWGESGIAYATYEWVKNSLLEGIAIVEVE
jgi:C1A family cysteine protease